MMVNMMYNDYLAHYGVMGMKWGVRRYQNKDGSLTNKGQKRYGTSNRYDNTNSMSEKGLKNYLKDSKKTVNRNHAAKAANEAMISNLQAKNRKMQDKSNGNSRRLDKKNTKNTNLINKARQVNSDITRENTRRNQNLAKKGYTAIEGYAMYRVPRKYTNSKATTAIRGALGMLVGPFTTRRAVTTKVLGDYTEYSRNA